VQILLELRNAGEVEVMMYIVTHKEAEIQEDDFYRGLCVGKYRADGMLSERDGENIAMYNDRINELTGLYWIWKNTTEDLVGMCHYRRFFQDGEQRAGEEKILEALSNADIILSDYVYLPWTVRQNIVQIEGHDLDAAAYRSFEQGIREHQPNYVDAFDKVLNGRFFHVCNMFVTRREILNEFCEWLFSFILEATDRVNVGNGDYFQRRLCGYYGETMWSVWMQKQNYKVKTMPILRIGG